MFSTSQTPLVYYSTPGAPKTVAVVDLRTGENVFELAIPVGKQLSMRFTADYYEYNNFEHTPDKLAWGVLDLGQRMGPMTNQTNVPSASASFSPTVAAKPSFRGGKV